MVVLLIVLSLRLSSGFRVFAIVLQAAWKVRRTTTMIVLVLLYYLYYYTVVLIALVLLGARS